MSRITEIADFSGDERNAGRIQTRAETGHDRGKAGGVEPGIFRRGIGLTLMPQDALECAGRHGDFSAPDGILEQGVRRVEFPVSRVWSPLQEARTAESTGDQSDGDARLFCSEQLR